MASGLLWSDVRRLFDPELMGALPDLCVPETSAGDWQELLDLVVSSGWPFAYREGETELPLPAAQAILARGAGAASAALHVRPSPRLRATLWFHAAEEISFDVDLRELQGQRQLDEFCGFLRVVGRRLGKPVLMDAEGGDPATHPVLGFIVEADRVITLDPAPES